jgi:hypothetical protein
MSRNAGRVSDSICRDLPAFTSGIWRNGNHFHVFSHRSIIIFLPEELPVDGAIVDQFLDHLQPCEILRPVKSACGKVRFFRTRPNN